MHLDQVDRHPFLAVYLGVVFPTPSMWIAGVMQGSLMWRHQPRTERWTYTFVEALNATHPYYLGRLFGGLLVLAGMLLMVWNTWLTARGAPRPSAVPARRLRSARLRTP